MAVVKFYLGQNEDHSPRGSVSESSQNLLQRGRRKCPYIRDFGEGGGPCSQAHILQKVAASLMKVTASLVKVTARHQEPASL